MGFISKFRQPHLACHKPRSLQRVIRSNKNNVRLRLYTLNQALAVLSQKFRKH